MGIFRIWLLFIYIFLQHNKIRRNIQSEQSVESDLFQLFTADLEETNQRGSGVV